MVSNRPWGASFLGEQSPVLYWILSVGGQIATTQVQASSGLWQIPIVQSNYLKFLKGHSIILCSPWKWWNIGKLCHHPTCNGYNFAIIHLTHRNVNGEALQLPKVPFNTSHTRIRISTTSHVRLHIRYYKSCALVWMCNEIEGSYDKIIITIVPSYTGQNITRLLPLALLLLLRTHNNTDGNYLHYGDTYQRVGRLSM